MHQWGKYASLDSFLQRWWGGGMVHNPERIKYFPPTSLLPLPDYYCCGWVAFHSFCRGWCCTQKYRGVWKWHRKRKNPPANQNMQLDADYQKMKSFVQQSVHKWRISCHGTDLRRVQKNRKMWWQHRRGGEGPYEPVQAQGDHLHTRPPHRRLSRGRMCGCPLSCLLLFGTEDTFFLPPLVPVPEMSYEFGDSLY